MEFLVEPMNMFGILGMTEGKCGFLACCNLGCDEGIVCSSYYDTKKVEE